jgi:hypothetical protein
MFNLVCICILLNPQFNGKMYKYQLMKIIFESLTLLVSCMSVYSNCVNCAAFQTLGAQIYRIYAVLFLNNIFYLTSIFSTIAVTYDRILLFHRGSTRYINLDFKYSLATILTIAIALNIPFLFAYRINQSPTQPSRFSFAFTEFGNSMEFRYYFILQYTIQSLVSFSLLLLLNFILARDFKGYIKSKNKLVSGEPQMTGHSNKMASTNLSVAPISLSKHSKVSNANLEASRGKMKKFTKMILLNSVLFMITRFIDLITAISTQLDQIRGIRSNQFTVIITFVCLQLTMTLYGCNLFINYYFNSQFNSQIKKFLSSEILKSRAK